jgi:alkylated DNA nucleotide flippase Atl1
MQVRETNLKELVQGEKQFRVPLWQRQYTWKIADHRLLWRDILEQYLQLIGIPPAPKSGHFLGSIVLSPLPPQASGVGAFLVVDGQQRLTTLMVLLCAIRDAAAKKDEQAIERYNELYLINKFQQGDGRFRLVPTQADRPSFVACVDQNAGAGGSDSIGQTYRFFRSQLELQGPDDEPFNLEQLTSVVVERLAVVDITTSHGDNAHRIFQSLNATGVGLTQADLLRNLIFMLLPTRASVVYEEVWRPMERLVGFENLEGLARVDLQRLGIDVAVDDVYRRHQERLEPMAGNEEAVEAVVRDLSRRAAHYKCIIDPTSEPDAEIRAGLERLKRWGAQTTHPVLMFAYDLRQRGLLPIEGMRDVLSYLESFLVRRQLAGIPRNALNRLFVQLIERLPEGLDFPEVLRTELSRQRRYWPTDDQLREAIRTRPFYFTGRGQQRTAILERLEESYEHPELIDFANTELSIEHVLPQTLSDEWRDHLTNLGQEPDTVHQELVHTLGNLTLTAFNGTLSNNPFERKKQIYTGSHLELNRALAEHDVWGQEQILERADELADQAIAIWPGPLPGIAEAPRGFDWSRINAAVAAIPRGRWTTYGDLAQLGGTAAMPVGQHMANAADIDNAYRVLGSDGRPRPDFHWDDPLDERDVLEVLKADGVRFGVSGAADPAQRITGAELAGLIALADDESLEESEETALRGEQTWSWQRYIDEMGIAEDRVSTGRNLADLIAEAIAERELPWTTVFNKGYVAFQRKGGYNTLIVDVYWKKAPRFAVKLPAAPSDLDLTNPYPEYEESWGYGEWGWTVDPLDVLPNVAEAVELATRYHPESGHFARDRLDDRDPSSRSDWLATLVEEARAAGELGTLDPTPDTVTMLRDERNLRWERIALRVFGDPGQVEETQALYDRAKGEGAAKRSYVGRGRRYPEMED